MHRYMCMCLNSYICSYIGTSVAERTSPCGRLKLLVYVSCGFEALKKDTAALLSAGWRIRYIYVHTYIHTYIHIYI